MAHKVEDKTQRKFVFMMKWQLSGTWEVLVKSLSLCGISMDMWGKCAESFKGVHRGNGIGKRNAEGRRLLEFCDEREQCMANTWLYKANKRKIIIVPMDVKQKLILCFREKNTQSIQGM